MRTRARTTCRTSIRHLAGLAAVVLATAFMSSCTSSQVAGAPSAPQTAASARSQAQPEMSEQEGPEAAAWSEETEEEAEAAGPEYPDDAFLFRRLMTTGSPDLDAFNRAKQQATALKALASKAAPVDAKTGLRGGAPRWDFIGPTSVGGRVVDGVVDPTQPNTIFVATATNGVWKSTNAGKNFSSVWPEDITHSMGALAITPDGTLFAGTGETNPGGGSITYGGDGVYRSDDQGRSWQRVGLTRSGTIGRIVVDPEHSNRIWVAVSGNLFTPGGQRGVYLTRNGGKSWKRSLRPPNELTGAADLAVDPSDSRHVIATMWDHVRKPDARIYTGLGSGVWETRNAGRTWRKIEPRRGLPASTANTGRIGVAFAPSDPDRVWVVYANDETGAFDDFFRSDDNGANWVRPPGADDLSSSMSVYGWWFARLYADPDDADRLYVLGLNMWETKDGAQSFVPIRGIHVDQHVVVYDPRVPYRVYFGNDGGLYVSEDDGVTFTQSDDQPWSQYAGLDVSEQDPSRVIGGLQDNGTRASWTEPPFGSVFGGDGQRSLIDPKDFDNYYACAQYGTCYGFDNGESYRMRLTSERFPYFMQYEFDPTNSDVMYGGGSQLNESTDGGRTWSEITGDLGKGEGGTEPNPLYRNHYGTISGLTVAPSDPDVIWVGTDNGYLYRSGDRGATWTELPPPVRPKLWIQRIVIDPRDADTVYLTFSGYRAGDESAYVLRSDDAGQSWRDITANLPHAPVNDLAVVRNTLYVATDLGVFTSSASRPHWSSYGRGIPQLITTDLRYVPQAKKLFVATFGMGVWSIKA